MPAIKRRWPSSSTTCRPVCYGSCQTAGRRRCSVCPGCSPRHGPVAIRSSSPGICPFRSGSWTAQLRTAMAWQHADGPEKVESWFLRDAPGFEIVAELSPRGDEAVFDKLAMSAFAGTPLEMAPRDLGIKAFAIAGVALEIGIAPTVWHGVDLGLIPVVVTDACGGRDHSAMHRVLDGFRFGGDALLTDVAAITPLLAARPSTEADP